jgi:hypothetical protein
MRVIEHKPPQHVLLNEDDLSLFFAGPIQGAPDWQTEGIKIVENFPEDEEIHILNPRREYLGEEFVYEKQVKWEKVGLNAVKKSGGVIFWFAKRDLSVPYEETRAYAQTTRIEFGRVMGWKDYDPTINVSIGIEPGYKGSEKYFKTCADEFELPIFPTLEETCIDALKLILDK